MKKEKITLEIELLEKGDIVLTSGGLAQILEDEFIEDYENNRYGDLIEIRWLESTGEHPSIGSEQLVNKNDCLFDWDTKIEDVKRVEKHLI